MSSSLIPSLIPSFIPVFIPSFIPSSVLSSTQSSIPSPSYPPLTSPTPPTNLLTPPSLYHNNTYRDTSTSPIGTAPLGLLTYTANIKSTEPDRRPPGLARPKANDSDADWANICQHLMAYARMDRGWAKWHGGAWAVDVCVGD